MEQYSEMRTSVVSRLQRVHWLLLSGRGRSRAVQPAENLAASGIRDKPSYQVMPYSVQRHIVGSKRRAFRRDPDGQLIRECIEFPCSSLTLSVALVTCCAHEYESQFKDDPRCEVYAGERQRKYNRSVIQRRVQLHAT